MLPVYAWLRFDPVLWLAFKHDWTPRYEFMASIFGEKDAAKFLSRRVMLVQARNKILPAAIHPSNVYEQSELFVKQNLRKPSGRAKRQEIINLLLFWALNPEINQFNIDSYKTRSAIVDQLLTVIFQNSLIDESRQVLEGLKKIVYSRITYQGAKGEPSPIVHDAIISGVGMILASHFNEVVRLRDAKLDKLIKVKLIKEIQTSKASTGSLAFSADTLKNDAFQPKFPLPEPTVKMLIEILHHYRYSSWVESREKTINLIQDIEKQLGFSLDSYT